MKKIYLLILGIIFLLGFILRIYDLGNFPRGFHRDEAFLGYNAYSILKTGKDMTGSFLPLHLESFIYSPAGYSYFSIPFIALFGLNSFSVRFASAFFGTLTIILVYLLVKELFDRYNIALTNKKRELIQTRTQNNKEYLALVSAGLLAISPWHINLSRTATENIIVVFFITLGVLFFLFWLKTNKTKWIIFSFLSFGITLFTYQAARSFIPLFIPLMVFSFFSVVKLIKEKLHMLIVLFFILIIAPVLFVLLSKEASLRINTVSIFATEGTKLMLEEKIREDGVSDITPLLTRIFHNKVEGYSSQIINNYFKHFSYEFLFTENYFPDRYRVPQAGIIYIFELPFFLLGIWFLLQNERRIGFFLLGWILLAPLGSSLAFDDIPNMQRTLIIFPALSIIIAAGFLKSLETINKMQIFKILFLVAVAIVGIYSFSFYLHEYYVHSPQYRAWYRHDGYQELIKKVNNYTSSYKKVVVTDRESAPTIFFLFFNAYNPADFQRETKDSAFRGFDRISFGKYQFTQEECPLKFDVEKDKLTGEKGILYVNSTLCKTPQDVKLLDIIKRSDHSEVFQILAPDN